MYGSPSPKPAAGPVSGLTYPIFSVLPASCASGRAQIGSANAPETSRPPAPAPARLNSSFLEIRRVSNSSGIYDLLGSGSGPGPGNAPATLRRPLSDCQDAVLLSRPWS